MSNSRTTPRFNALLNRPSGMLQISEADMFSPLTAIRNSNKIEVMKTRERTSLPFLHYQHVGFLRFTCPSVNAVVSWSLFNHGGFKNKEQSNAVVGCDPNKAIEMRVSKPSEGRISITLSR